MQSLIRGVLLFLGVMLVLNVFRGYERNHGAPRRPVIEHPGRLGDSPRRGPLLPPPSSEDPMVLVEPEQHQGVSVGTSFAVSEAGVWVTARHVVQGCTDIAERGPNGWDAVRVAWVHPHADMALIRSQGAPTHFALANDDIVSNQDGYAFGYPQGRPGSVHGHLIGRTQIRSPGLFTGTAPTLAWAEVERQPAFKGSLGGISGGPLLDANGRVLGVVVAEIPRRGRFETLAPEVLREVAAHGRLVPPTSHAPVVVSLPEADFGRVGDELREQYAVSQVACAVR